MAKLGSLALQEEDELQRLRTQQLLESPTDVGIFDPTAEEIDKPGFGSFVLGGGTGGLFGADPREAIGFSDQAGLFLGDLALAGATTVLGALALPGGGAIAGAKGIQGLTSAFVRQQLFKSTIRGAQVGTFASQPTAFILETDPVETAIFFAATEGAGANIAKRFSLYQQAKKIKFEASETAKVSAKDVILKDKDLIDNAKILAGEKEFVPNVSDLGAEQAKKTERVKTEIDKIKVLLDERKKIIDERGSVSDTIREVSRGLGVQKFAPGEIDSGVRASLDFIDEAIEELGGISRAEAEVLRDLLGEGTFLLPQRSIDRALKTSPRTRTGIPTDSPFARTLARHERGNRFLRGQEGEIAPDFQTPRGGVVGRGGGVSPERVAEIQRVANELLDDLHIANIKTQIGLKQSASAQQVIDHLEDLVKKLDDQGAKLFQPTRRELQIARELRERFGNITREDLTDVNPEFKKTVEFAEFESSVSDYVAKLDGTFGDVEQREAVILANAVLEDAGKQFNKQAKTFHKDLKKTLERHDPTTTQELGQIESNISIGKLDELQNVQPRTRRALLDFIAGEIDDIPEALFAKYAPDVLEQETQIASQIVGQTGKVSEAALKDFENIAKINLEKLMKNQVALEGIIDASGNDQLRKAYLLYKATLGDRGAARKLKAIEHTVPGKNAKEITLSQVETVDEIAPKPKQSSSTPKKGSVAQDPAAGAGQGSSFNTTLDESFEAFQSTLHDITPFERLFRGFGRIADLYIERTANLPVLNAVFRKVRELRDVWQDAYVLARREFVDSQKRMDDFIKHELKPDTDTGKSSLDFVRHIDEKIENIRLEAKAKKQKITEADLELEIQDELARQPAEIRKNYRKYRAFDDEILDNYNKMVREVNERVARGDFPKNFEMREIPRKAGHAPIVYDGDLIIRVSWEDAAGTKHIYSDFVYGKEQAHRSILKFLDDQKNLHGSTPGEIQVIPRIFHEDPDLNSIASIMDEGKTIFGQSAGFIDEKVVKGEFTPDNLHEVFFAGSRPRLLNVVDKRIGVMKALQLRTFMANKAIHYTIPRLETELAARQLQKHGLNKWARYLRTYANDQVGRSRGLEQSFDEFIGSFLDKIYKVPAARQTMLSFGLTPHGRNTRSIARGLTFFGRAAALGINLGTAFINMMIAGTNVMPLVNFRSMMKGMNGMSEVFKKNSIYKPLFDKLGLRVTHGGLGYMENIGASTGAFGRNTGKIADWLDNKLMFAFNSTEDMVRAYSAVTFRHHAQDMSELVLKGVHKGNWKAELLEGISKRMGKEVTDPAVYDEYAVQMVRKTNFIFDLTDAPEIFRVVPLKPFLQFKNFFAKELEFIFEVGSKSPTDFVKVMGGFAALGGALGLPATAEIDALSRTFFGFSPKLWAEENMPDVMVAGFPALMGIDMSTRINFGNLGFLAKNPFGIAPSKIGAGINYFRQGDMEKARAILTPNGVRVLTQMIELATTGEVRDPFSGGIATMKADDENFFATLFSAATGIPTRTKGRFMNMKAGMRFVRDGVKAARGRAFERALLAERRGDKLKANKILARAGIKSSQYKAFKKLSARDRAEFLEDLLPETERRKYERFLEGAR